MDETDSETEVKKSESNKPVVASVASLLSANAESSAADSERKVKAAFGPLPLSYYVEHQRVLSQFYSHGRKKKGQPWDAFKSWGRRDLLMTFKDDEPTAVESMLLPMMYRATSVALPIAPANHISPCFEVPNTRVLENRDRMRQIKEFVLNKISRVRCFRYRTKADTRQVKKAAKQMLTAVRKAKTDLSKENIESAAAAFLSNNRLVDKLFSDLVSDSRVLGDTHIDMLPHDLLGGSMQVASCRAGDGDEEDYWLHTTGSMMSEIALKQVCKQGETIEAHHLDTVDTGDTVRQVALQTYSSENNLISVRCPDKLNFYTIKDQRICLSASRDIPSVSHVSLSPFYPEAVYVENKSTVKIWNCQVDSELVCSDWDSRHSYRPDMRTVHYGSHPRNLILTEPSVCVMYDARTKGTCLDLFEIEGNRLMRPGEKIVTSTQCEDFRTHILSQHTLVTIDQRFPRYPLMYKELPVLTHSMLIDNRFLSSEKELLLIGCPVNGEIFAFFTNNKEAAIQFCPIWKCSAVSDMMYYPKLFPRAGHRLLVDAKLNCGVIGVASTCVSDDRFSILMQTGQGDVFEQTYVHNEDPLNADVTYGAGGGVIDKPDIPEFSVNRCYTWYEEACSHYKLPEYREITHRLCSSGFLPNISCSVCSGKEHDTELSTTCLCCELTTDRSRDSFSCIVNNEYHKFTDECDMPRWLRNMDVEDLIYDDPNSRLLYQLWNDEDFTDALMDRDKEYDARYAAISEGRQTTKSKEGRVDAQSEASLRASELDSLSDADLHRSLLLLTSTRANKDPLANAPGFKSPRRSPSVSSKAPSSVAGMPKVPLLSSTLNPAFLTPPLHASQLSQRSVLSSLKRGRKRHRKGF